MAGARFWLAVLSICHLYTMIGWCLAVQYCPNMCAVTRHHLLKNPSFFTLGSGWLVGLISQMHLSICLTCFQKQTWVNSHSRFYFDISHYIFFFYNFISFKLRFLPETDSIYLDFFFFWSDGENFVLMLLCLSCFLHLILLLHFIIHLIPWTNGWFSKPIRVEPIRVESFF